MGSNIGNRWLKTTARAGADGGIPTRAGTDGDAPTMRHILGISLGIAAGYLASMGIALFVHADDIAMASLLLMLTCCGIGGILGLLSTVTRDKS